MVSLTCGKNIAGLSVLQGDPDMADSHSTESVVKLVQVGHIILFGASPLGYTCCSGNGCLVEDVHRQAMMSVLLSPDTGSSSCLKFLSLLSNTG